MSRVAVVTGSNKGIGLGIVKGLCQRFDGAVYLTSRDEARGKEAVAKLRQTGLNPQYHQLDVADRGSVQAFRDHLAEKYGGIDVLFNNAGVVDKIYTSTNYEDAKRVIDINYKSVLTMKELIYPLIRNNGRIINISSDCGHLSNLRNKFWIQKLSNKDLSEADVAQFVDWYLDAVKSDNFNRDDFADGATISSYRVAKIALSAITMVHQRQLASRNVSVNSLHPGFVRTDMTSGLGIYNTDESAETPIYLALDAPDSLKGAYIWFDKSEVDWFDYRSDHYFKIKTIE